MFIISQDERRQPRVQMNFEKNLLKGVCAIMSKERFSKFFLLLALISLVVLTGGCETESQKNSKEVKRLREGAVNGSSAAQIALAGVYTTGQKGIEINPSAAVFWFRKVAVKGQADVQYTVGMHYYTGEGVSKDEEEGLYWINQAAKQGHSQAKDFLKKTPHDETIIEASSNPKNWGYVFSSALYADLWDAYGWMFLIGVFAAICTGPVGIVAFIGFILYFIS